MDAHREKLTIRRIERLVARLSTDSISATTRFALTYHTTDRPTPWERREEGQHPIQEGTQWGTKWQSAWFHATAAVPRQWRGGALVGWFDLGGEALVYRGDGTPYEGISAGSIWNIDYRKTWVRLPEAVCEQETVQLWVEAAANTLFGVERPEDPADDDPDRYGKLNAIVHTARLGLLNEEVWHLGIDLDLLLDQAKQLPVDSVRRARILTALSEAADAYCDDLANATSTRALLRPLLAAPTGGGALSTVATGHAHIDTAWLWPMRETVRKCARTFANQLRLIERYPDYVFGASQPQHYQFVKDHYPALFEEIKGAVANGQWELQGGMWVEADCNLIDGESLVRQIVLGKAFFQREFGVDVRNVWLPDVFGYSAAMPQIMRRSGIDSFLTQKISWNQFNHFPHHTFWWRGIDGSEVLAHFPPEDSYNSPLRAAELLQAQGRFAEKDRVDTFMTLFGVGDGGGGPKQEHVERGLRMANLEGLPRVRMEHAQTFFDELHHDQPKLATWVGELYLELHRGTLTTQGAIKRGNRKLEQALRELEIIATLLPPDRYPRKELDRLWKVLLVNQFHDIIPGSSIKEVYEVARAEHARALDEVVTLQRTLAARLLSPREGSVTAVNTLSGPSREVVLIDPTRGETVDAFTAQEGAREIALDMAGGEVRALTLESTPAPHRDDPLVLENGLIRYEFDRRGRLVRAFDKELSWEVIGADRDGEYEGGNAFTLYEDRPNDWDAWDIDIFYEEAVSARVEACEYRDATTTGARCGTHFTYRFGASVIEQYVWLRPGSKRLDFVTRVDWHERHRMLRVAFPTTVQSDFASFEVQYGYVRRSNHRNTSWDMAKFESVGHRWVDLSQPDRGAALLNDCKYGYKVLDGVLDLNLLRSPVNPDADADQGEHTFTYAFLPHCDGVVRASVMEEADSLNRIPRIVPGVPRTKDVAVPVRIESTGVTLEVVKRAENDDELVIRLVERKGASSTARVQTVGGHCLVETDLLEHVGEKPVEIACGERLSFSPFEIRTFRVR